MPNIAPAIIKHLLEDEEPEMHLETRVRARNQERIEAAYLRAWGKPVEGDLAFNSGSRRFERIGGVWYVITRRKNPAYWDQPQYFIIYGPMRPFAFIVCKKPRRLINRFFQRAIVQIYRDVTGKSPKMSEGFGVDGVEQQTYDARVAGRKPEPAYEIFLDGTWTRTDQRKK